MTRFSWDQRIGRAEHLAINYEFASEILKFYREVACFQKSLYEKLESACGGGAALRAATTEAGKMPAPRSAAFQVAIAEAGKMPALPLLALVQRIGPPPLAQAASALAQANQARWEHLLTSCWKSDGLPPAESNDSEVFFARALLQPYAEYLAVHTDLSLGTHGAPTCPFCHRKPQAGILRAEGYGARRSLLCSLCSTEWDYRRIVCPACGEDRFDQLPVYTADQFEHVRVEACDRCKAYIKTVDLTKDGLAVPVVDELATTPLDLWAREKGYKKLQPNLLGL